MAQTGKKDHVLTQRRTTLVSVAAAALLVALKLGVGVLTASLGLISSGIESSGDVIAATLTFFGVGLGGRPADPEHPYGHRRAENLGALGEAAILLAGGVLVAVDAVVHLSGAAEAPDIHWQPVTVLAVPLVVDLSRMIISMRSARRYGS